MTRYEVHFELVQGVALDVKVRADKLGSEGWELVQVGPFTPNSGLTDTFTVVWFKRIRKLTPSELREEGSA